MRINSFKKGDLSINTIVVAAIAIMVLLVIILIFTSNMRKPANEVGNVNEDRGNLLDDLVGRESCEGHGECITECPDNMQETSLYTCGKEGSPTGYSDGVCCIPK